jgi:two-component system response regulator RpfG
VSASIRDPSRPLVVIVDDQSTGRRILTQLVGGLDANLEVVAFGDGPSAIECIRRRTPDLILTDYMMPDMDGIAFIRCVRSLPACADVPLVVVTIVDDKQVRYQAFDAGATDFLNRPIDEYECRARCRNLLMLRRQQKMIQDRAALLEDQVTAATRAIRARERETLLRLAKAGEYRDEGTGDHVLRIARYCRLMAQSLDLAVVHCEQIELAAPMHDIGKVGVPDRILLKPGRLTREEFAIMQHHTEIGYEILKDSPSRYLQLGATIALCHHERFDGTGYPAGLAGAAIPLEARIVAVADVFDALTSVRPYKPAWSIEEAVAYIRARAGGHFDPDCVAAFLDCLDQIQDVQVALADEARDVRGSPGRGP